MTRNDVHTPSNFVPSDYHYVMSYSAPSAQAGLPFGVNWENIRNFVEKNDSRMFRRSIRNCHVCGAHFTHGDLWHHIPSDSFICLGHICADKYGLQADREEYFGMKGREIRKAEKTAVAARIAEDIKLTLEEHDGLAEALETDHHIVQDIARRFESTGRLSDKQIRLVFNLAERAQDTREKNCPAPEGKGVIKGRIVSLKKHVNNFSGRLEWKITVKVNTVAGVWLCWGTLPRALGFDADGITSLPRDHIFGREVEFTATLQCGRDAHFAFFKRPSKARFTSEPSFETV